MKKVYLTVYSFLIRILLFGIMIIGFLFRVVYVKTKIKKFRIISMKLYTKHFTLNSHKRFISSGFSPEDLIVCSFPRSGTNWICMIVYHLLKNGNLSQMDSLENAYLHLENCLQKELNNLKTPKIIFTHRSFKSIYRKKMRYIYCIRDGKDVSVSYFRFFNDYYLRQPHWPYSDFPSFFDLFCSDFFGEISSSSNWFVHVSTWLKNKHNKNIFFVKYEDLKENPNLVISQIATFLKLTVTPERIEEIIKNCSFDSMKSKSYLFDDDKRKVNCNAHVRKGVIGDWENHFTEEQKNIFNQKIQKYQELHEMYPINPDL